MRSRVIGFRYGKALFTTPARQLAPPTNLRYSVSNDNVVTIEWDKDKDHRRYQLVYTDQNGVERSIPPLIRLSLPCSVSQF